MGYKALIFIIFGLIAWADYSHIDELIEQIKLKREGLQLSIIKDPFIEEKKVKKLIKIPKIKKVRKFRLILQAILNDRVKINGKWYRLGQYVKNYKIVRIGDGFVILRGKKSLRLFLRNRKIRLWSNQ